MDQRLGQTFFFLTIEETQMAYKYMNSAQPHLSLQNLILPRDSTHPLDLWKPKSLMILRVGKAVEQWKVSHT